jgi:Tfp pilus assembly protein FimT
MAPLRCGRAERASGQREARRAFAGVTLLELIAVLVLLGVFTAVAMARFGVDPLKNFASQSDARRLASDLVQVRRRAISSGDNHYVELTSGGGAITGYSIYRRLVGGGTEIVDAPRTFVQQETVSATHSQLEFNFEGAALAAYQVTFTGPDRTAQVTVVPVTGAVRVTGS